MISVFNIRKNDLAFLAVCSLKKIIVNFSYLSKLEKILYFIALMTFKFRVKSRAFSRKSRANLKTLLINFFYQNVVTIKPPKQNYFFSLANSKTETFSSLPN